jgi:hypothetical protein
MNERIKELSRVAHSAADSTYAQAPDAIWLKEYNKKFAELIVRECANAADMAQDAGCEYAGDYVAEYMGFGQEHGVTEWRAK